MMQDQKILPLSQIKSPILTTLFKIGTKFNLMNGE